MSIDGIRAVKVVLVGRMSHANFHRRFLWRGLILDFQKMFHLDLLRGPVEVNLSFWLVR